MAKKTVFVNVRFPEELYKQLHADSKKASDIVRDAVSVWLEYFKMDNKRIIFDSDENYALIGKTGCGKTQLLKKILPLIPKRKIILDTSKEYSELGRVYAVKKQDSEIFEGEKKKVMDRFWAKKEALKARDLCDTEPGNIILHLETDKETEGIFMSEYLGALLERVDKKPELLVIEGAKRYEELLQSFISECLKKNIQTILVSQLPLDSKILANTTPIIGCYWTDLMKNTNLPEPVIETCKLLKQGEWIWFETKSNAWHKISSNYIESEDKTNTKQPEQKRNTTPVDAKVKEKAPKNAT